MARGDLENDDLSFFFQDLVLLSISHITLPVSVSLAANYIFLLAAQRAVSSANWDFEFCLW